MVRQFFVFIMIWESSENQFGLPKKRSKKISNFFLKSGPLDKFLDSHLLEREPMKNETVNYLKYKKFLKNANFPNNA